MSDVKKVRGHLKNLTRPQLVALAVQRLELRLDTASSYTTDELIAQLEEIEFVLTPVRA